MNRPTVKEIEKNYKKYLIKLKGYGLCFLAKDCWGDICVFDKSKLDESNCVMSLDNSLYGYWDEEFRACAVFECEDEISPIRHVMNDREPEKWDWCEEDDAEEMTLSEVCKALGKNIKIIKE